MTEADLVILGAGSGGYACALRATQLGMSVILVDEAELGGTCLHRGCIPTKALLHAAEVADTARESAQFGVNTTLDGIDAAKVLAYKDGVVGRLYKGLQGLVKGRGVTQVAGTGRIVSPRAVEVDGTRYTGKNLVIATGSFARVPEAIPGLTVGERILTSDEALTLDRVPSSAIVIGGGVIGVEFASIWRSFGAEVTVVEAQPRLLPGDDEFCSKLLERAFRRRGIITKLGAAVAGVEATEAGVAVDLGDAEPLTADVLLVAVGRGPRTNGIGLDDIGVTTDRGFVPTSDVLETNVEGVYAVGDIVPGPQLAHRGFAHGIFLAEHLAGLQPRPIVDSGIPRVTYSDPEVASVGLTEAAAREKFGSEVTTVEYNLAGNGKSQILGTQGAVKIVARTDAEVLGMHLVGARVGELIGEAQLIVNWGAEASDVADLVHAHPTQNEAVGEAFLSLAGKPLHSHA